MENKKKHKEEKIRKGREDIEEERVEMIIRKEKTKKKKWLKRGEGRL